MEGTPIHRAAEFYRRGVVCAAEVWNVAFDSLYLSAETASRDLCASSAVDEVTLRNAFSPYVLEECADERVRAAIVRWLGEGR